MTVVIRYFWMWKPAVLFRPSDEWPKQQRPLLAKIKSDEELMDFIL